MREHALRNDGILLLARAGARLKRSQPSMRRSLCCVSPVLSSITFRIEDLLHFNEMCEQNLMAFRTRWKSLINSILCGIAFLCLAGGCQSQSGTTRPDQEDGASTEASIPDPLVIQLTGTEHQWRAAYPMIDGALPAIDELQAGYLLHVPLDTEVVLILKSTDYIYTLAIPELGLKEIAIPDLEFRMTFRPTSVGQYPLIGEELCGLPGRDRSRHLVVESRQQFLTWLGQKNSSL